MSKKLIKAGIAGAPVTDWWFYDSKWGESFLQLPQNNPAGYDAASLVPRARDLHGYLMLVYGTNDDNVTDNFLIRREFIALVSPDGTAAERVNYNNTLNAGVAIYGRKGNDYFAFDDNSAALTQATQQRQSRGVLHARQCRSRRLILRPFTPPVTFTIL